MKTGKHIKLLLKLHKLENDSDGAKQAEALKRLEKRLDPAVLRRYRRLKERKGTGVAILQNRVCSECKMVYPESHEMLKYRNFVHSCEYCGRLLIVTDKSA
jgi:predicted  nucleic acid-binding Zn-ribbon protein